MYNTYAQIPYAVIQGTKWYEKTLPRPEDCYLIHLSVLSCSPFVVKQNCMFTIIWHSENSTQPSVICCVSPTSYVQEYVHCHLLSLGSNDVLPQPPLSLPARYIADYYVDENIEVWK